MPASLPTLDRNSRPNGADFSMTSRLFAPRALLAGLLATFMLAAQAQAQLFETKAAQAYMIDSETGTVLFSKDPDKLITPASLAKMMTMEVVFDALKSGRYSLDDMFGVSENAWRTGGAASRATTMFAAVRSQIRIEDLIKGVTVQVANDGCIILAEGMAGSEANFAVQMTERARQIGLTKSTFVNSTGLPAPGQQTTVRELTQLALHLWQAYPEYYRYYSLPDFTWNKILQRNRNPLIAMDFGADGLATGFTEGEGFAIVGSVNRDGRRLFLAMAGMATDRERAEEARKLLDWGMRAFEKTEIFAKDETVGEAQVFGGTKSHVALVAPKPISLFLPVANRERLVARIVYDGPVVAPIAKGTPIGTLKVWIGDTLSQETPLYAAEAVGVGSLQSRAFDAVKELAIGWLR